MTADGIPICFLGRPGHRKRQRDTETHLPQPFYAIASTDGRHLQEGLPGHGRWRGRLERLARRWGAINFGTLWHLPVPAPALIYTWGKIPLWPLRPRYVVELDNPYVLALYGKIGWLRRHVLRRFLLSRRCAGIVCISRACRASTAVVLGSDVAERSRIVYPYLRPAEQARPGVGPSPNVVFVGSQFWLKGGFELCEAFAVLVRRFPEARLTVISNTEPEIRARFDGVPIEFIPARLSRREVAGHLLSADVFAMPSLAESFGMAVLEAVAHGLPVLTTDLYALPELVQDGRNGVLLADRFGYWRDGRANFGIWRAANMEQHVRGRRFPELRDQIVQALSRLLADRRQLTAMGAASRALYEERFAPDIRQAALRDALASFMAQPGGR